MYKPSKTLVVVGLLVLAAIYASIWFVDDEPWLLVVPLVGGAMLWATIIWDVSRQRVPFMQAMHDANNSFEPRWRIVFIVAGLAYGLLLGFRGR